LTPSLAAINSAFVLDISIGHCRWLDHAISLPAYTAITPLVDFLVRRHLQRRHHWPLTTFP
jgi:hypothetical protein